MPEKEVKVKVVTDLEASEVESLEARLKRMQNQKLRADVEANTAELEDVDARIKSLKTFLSSDLVGGVKLDVSEVEKAEKELEQLESRKYDLKIKVATDELRVAKNLEDALSSTEKAFVSVDTKEVVSAKTLIDALSSTEQVYTDVDTGEVVSAKELIESLNDTEQVFVDVDTGEVASAKEFIESLTSTQLVTVDVDVDSSAMDSLNMSVQNVSQGVSQAKQGFSELKGNVDEVAQAGMQMEQNMAFLTMNLGADKAKKTMQDISDIVASMPGDDNTMRSVLSTAQALGNNLNAEQMKDATGTMADYMSASATMGKQAIESQQDIMKYLLDGNTAELERGSIVSSQVDKLKDANTFMERQAAMQQVLNDLGYGGISQQDTMLNKQAEWEGMIYNSESALSTMWLGAEKGAMDYILKLNDATDGLLGMGIVAGEMATGPLIEILTGVGQIGMGLKGFKEGITILKELSIVQKLSAAATWLHAQAEAFLNLIMDANPIVLVVLALIALAAAAIWAYQNVDWFREAVDNLWVSIQDFAGQVVQALTDIYTQASLYWNNFMSMLADLQSYLVDCVNNFVNTITNAVNGIITIVQAGVNWIITGLQGLWDYIMTLGGLIPANTEITGNKVIDSILKVMLFIMGLPAQITMVFVNIIAKALGFGDNFSQKMIKGASDAVTGFVTWISSLPGKLKEELDEMLNMASNFALEIANRLTGGAAGMVVGWVTGSGEHSPGYMYEALIGELTAMVNAPGEYLGQLVGLIGEHGAAMAEILSETLFNMSFDQLINNLLWLYDTFMSVSNYIYTIGGLWPAEANITGNAVIDVILRVLAVMATLPLQVYGIFVDMLANALGFKGNFVQTLFATAMNGVTFFTNAIQGIPQALQRCLNWAYQIVMSNPLVQALQWLGDKAAYAFSVLGLGQGSPGKIYRALHDELKWSKELVEGSDLADSAKVLGANMGNSFKPDLKVDPSNLSNNDLSEMLVNGFMGQQINNFYFKDILVDDDKRMEKIYNYISHRMSWDNHTAGRTV